MTKKKLGRCVALDSNGRRCRREATVSERYHGDDELYGYLVETNSPQWVVVELCDRHVDLKPEGRKGVTR
ncbi:MAG: hypothetical protein RLY20_885 [Verrucomicrobiota bacterium]